MGRHRNNGRVRPVKCLFCHKRLYYVGDAKYRKEYQITLLSSDGDYNETYYAHEKCWEEHIHPPPDEEDNPDLRWVETFKREGR